MSSDHYHWDGSRKDDSEAPGDPFSAAGRSRIRIHRSSPTTTLRRKCQSQCRFCGHSVEYFDRFDGGRLPMIPHLFPARHIPPRLRWHVEGGMAYTGCGGNMLCRVAHPAFCPMVDHDDNDPEMERARRALAVRTRRWIDAGEFVPDLRPSPTEADVAEQHVDEGDIGVVRHLIRYTNALWLGPTVIDRIRCVAMAASTGERCKNLVLSSAVYDGEWEEMEIPIAPGRAGQQTLWAGTTMWVYGLHALTPSECLRWIKQRCTYHLPHGSTTPDNISPQWIRFDPLRHAEFILYQRPIWAPEIKGQEHPLLSRLKPVAKLTGCAEPECRNTTPRTVAAEWRCWKCGPRYERRQKTHRMWQRPAPPPEATP
ncbi:DUF6083 domain-containing protein [Streptomyces sp. NPDC003032]